MFLVCVFFFFFKQKTAYEMRISDWSSDVCSSDLADLDWANIWKNPGETAGNGIDDDGNGYVDDIIGWDFLGNNNKPWDHDGHGTITAGIIAADSGNGMGMAGINPHARIMVLKALNAFGHSRASYIAPAVQYAADIGSPVIHLS